MNKYQEAFKRITFYPNVYTHKEFNLIKELVDKETPMKVEIEPFYQTGDCPCCKSTVGRLDIYCKKCGQKLDWSEE